MALWTRETTGQWSKTLYHEGVNFSWTPDGYTTWLLISIHTAIDTDRRKLAPLPLGQRYWQNRKTFGKQWQFVHGGGKNMICISNKLSNLLTDSLSTSCGAVHLSASAIFPCFVTRNSELTVCEKACFLTFFPSFWIKT